MTTSSEVNVLPFSNVGKYTGVVTAEIWQKDREEQKPLNYVRIIGERVILESVQGNYHGELKKVFSVASDRNELSDLTRIFGSATGMQNYASRKSEDEQKILQRLEKDASRPYNGNLFSGYHIVHKETGTIIGRIAVGAGYRPGESQSGLIVREDHKGKGYAKEAICLMVPFAQYLYENKCCVGGAPVDSFTATVLDTNDKEIAMLKRLGLQYIRPLERAENYSDDPRSLYGISADKVQERANALLDTEPTVKVVKVV